MFSDSSWVLTPGCSMGATSGETFPGLQVKNHILQVNSLRGGQRICLFFSLCPCFCNFFLHGIVLRVLYFIPQKFGTAQSYQSASGNCILKKFAHGPISYRPLGSLGSTSLLVVQIPEKHLVVAGNLIVAQIPGKHSMN